MFQSFIYRLLRRRHFWRYASFDEVAELYASRTMRLLAQSMIALFIAIYLYQHGFSVLFIACYFAAYFTFCALVAYPAARYVAHFGPKHGILAGNLLYIPALVFFTLVPEYGVYAVAAFSIFRGLSMTVYDISYLVDFSKVKHAEHAGKEIGFMQIFDRISISLAPLIGGVVAFSFGPEATMWLSAVLFAVASWPLLRTAEQVQTSQKLPLAGFPWRTTYRSFIAESAIGFDNVASNFVWVLFISIAVFAGSGSDLYLKIGALASITVFTSFAAAYTFGRLIDRRRGGDLLRIATIANAFTHLFRPFVTTPVAVAGANITNEIATAGYSMAFIRGIFDTADRSGHRILYLLFLEIAVNVGAVIGCSVFIVLLLIMPTTILAMQVFFGVTSVYVLLVMTGRFSLYKTR